MDILRFINTLKMLFVYNSHLAIHHIGSQNFIKKVFSIISNNIFTIIVGYFLNLFILFMKFNYCYLVKLVFDFIIFIQCTYISITKLTTKPHLNPLIKAHYFK